MIELYLLMGFILMAAVVAVESHDLLSAVVSVEAVGLGLCIIFLLLGAPELAITQLVVEILALIVLIRATLAKSVPETYRGRERLAYGMVTCFILALAGVAYFALRQLPAFGAPQLRVAQNYLDLGLQQTGATNLIAAVALNFRGFDSLGAVAAMFTAVIGALVILRGRGRKETNERDELDS
ncbi:MAG: hydrogenase subunit MbhD domain-containing protein [Candidatus Margulisiibacteriota bacterium]